MASIHGGPDDYVVTLSGATFLADEHTGERTFILNCGGPLGCNQFTASRESGQLRFRLASNDERVDDEFAGYGGMIVELIPPENNRLGIQGAGLSRLDATTIQASIVGRVWFCHPPPYSDFYNECAICNSANVALTFTRR